MGRYLNLDNDNFADDLNSPIYVDKSLLIKETNSYFRAGSFKFMCVTRPRRFGKTMALSMLNAYYSKGCDSRELFKDLAIAKDPSFEKHLNKRNVLWIDMAEIYSFVYDPNDFLKKLEFEVIADLKESYEGLDFAGLRLAEAIRLIKSKTGDTFVFLIDEWDVVYREQPQNKELCDSFTMLLRSLFKSSGISACFDLVYMTGILPIRRYSTQSALNVFEEYNMLSPKGLAPFFGFTEGEVKSLCEKHGADFAEIKSWYDGYRLGGMEIYNPKSVVEAIQTGECGDYWTSTSAIEAVTNYMSYDRGALKGEIIRMLAGERVVVSPGRFGNDLTQIDSKDAALTVLIHLGYLAYAPGENPAEPGSCFIPNKEIGYEFEEAIEKLDWKEARDPIGDSPSLLQATIDGDAEKIDATLDRNHRELASPFTKNDEGVLALVVIVSYYKARERYWVRKEETSINGRSDVSLFPKKPGLSPIIIELKVGKSPDEALAQIKEKRYWEAWEGFKGEIILVGISYDQKSLKHSSKVERIKIE